jgi:NADH-quinone oxidoreductase subunit J
VVQIAVYAGAIMVLFLFIIMLLGAEKLGGVAGEDKWQRYLAGSLALILVGVVFVMALIPGGDVTLGGTAEQFTAVQLGQLLFQGYVFPFEVTGVLLLTAMIGVVVLGRKKRG